MLLMTSFSCRIRKEGESLKEGENEVTLRSSRRQGGRRSPSEVEGDGEGEQGRGRHGSRGADAVEKLLHACAVNLLLK